MKYGEEAIVNFDIEKDLEIWPNKSERNYVIKITLPEFCCLCPRSGYPDFATIYIEYIPDKWVVELKAIKLYINSFMNKNISHEDSINEIYSVLQEKLKPKFIKIIGDFNPRGNVHTVIEIDSQIVEKSFKPKEKIIEKFIEVPIKEHKSDSKKSFKFNDNKSFKNSKTKKEPFFSPDKFKSQKPKVIKK